MASGSSSSSPSLAARFRSMTLHRGVFLACLVLQPFLLTQLMPPPEYSRYAFYISLIVLAMELSNLGLGEGFQRFGLKLIATGRADGVARAGRWTLGLRLLAAAVVCAILGALVSIIPALRDTPPALFGWIVAGVIGATLHEWTFSIFYGLRRFESWGRQFAMFGLLRVIMVPGAYVLAGPDALIPAYALTYWALIAILWVKAPPFALLRRAARQTGPDSLAAENAAPFSLRGLLAYSLPYHVSTMLKRNAHPLGVILTGVILSKDAAGVGFFHLSWMIQSVAAMFSDNVLHAVYPEVMRAEDRGDAAERNRWVVLEQRLLTVWGLAALATWLAAGPAALMLLPGHWRGLYPWVAVALGALLCRGLYQPALHLLLARQQSGRYFGLTSIFFVSFLILFPVCVMLLGDIGAIAALLGAEAVLGGAGLVVTMRRTGSREAVLLAAKALAAVPLIGAGLWLAGRYPAVLAWGAVGGVLVAWAMITGLITRGDWQSLARVILPRRREAIDNDKGDR